jgi:hypothetical protein
MPYLNYQYAVSDRNFLDCTLYYEPATPATFDDPGDPGVLTLDSVKAGGIDILEFLSYHTIKHIENCAEITFDTMGDPDD